MNGWMRRVAAAVTLAAAMVRAAPQIEHTPVTVGVKGEPLMIRAKVDGRGRAVRAVQLHYSTSRDAAPFAVPMQSTGAGVWVGTIPAGVLAVLDRVSYYISAEDDRGATAETPWVAVRLQAPSGEAARERPGWVTPALIGGGVALAAGGVAVWAANSGDGDGGGDVPGGAPGTYVGTATRCQTLTGAAPTCETRPATIRIADDGTVSSSDLHPGVAMQTRLSGTGFVLTAPVRVPGTDGEVRYIGTLVGGRIVGSIEGSAGSGTNTVLYSGTFSAAKQ
ncbi:MAG: hypothetical protein N2652_02770 [Kiritimatiellae bacterium]|nr:hypothetical protein [Kiritimatiellia bacterium]